MTQFQSWTYSHPPQEYKAAHWRFDEPTSLSLPPQHPLPWIMNLSATHSRCADRNLCAQEAKMDNLPRIGRRNFIANILFQVHQMSAPHQVH